MTIHVPYCGAAPLPEQLLSRFNLDPVLIISLVLFCAWQSWSIYRRGDDARHHHAFSLAGWLIACAAFVSPLCALSVALFSARVTQHMILILIAAPLIAAGLPRAQPAQHSLRLWFAAGFFFAALWFWHMPIPYEWTFASVAAYWAMHVTLFGSGILLWRELLDHPAQQTGQVLVAGTLSFVHMGLLGAVLTLAERPLFQWHFTTTEVWGLSPLQDQQLGGSVMWVPGIALFLWTALRSLGRLWEALDRARPA